MPGEQAVRRVRLVEVRMGEEELRAVERVLRSGMLTRGEETRRFEEEFARYVGTRYAVTFMNGTIALEAALQALGVGPGDEVAVPAFTFTATANAVLRVGARPVFVDVEPDTLTMGPDSLLERITPRTRAVIPVHLYGHMADMDAIMEIALDHRLRVLEDAAQAHGASCKDSRAGSVGDAGAFSFYATKNMTMGEGGAVTTSVERVYRRLLLLRKHGEEKRYETNTLGSNLHLTEMQAAIGRIQLRRLDEYNEARRRNAAFLSQRLGGLVETPRERPGCKHVYHQYVIRTEPGQRDRLASYLQERGVETAVHYPRPLHLHPLYRSLGHVEGEAPVAEEASLRVLSLPVHPFLSRDDLEYIAGVVEAFFQESHGA